MTPQEQTMLEEFLQRLTTVQGVAKDADAERLIRQRLADHPDATYLLVQRCLLQQQALENAKNEIARLQGQAANQGGGSFLGTAQQPDWGRANAMPQATMAPTPAAVQAAGPAAAASRAPSFLASAATTAAGVAGGMFLFEGIESLIGGHGHGMGASGQDVIQENIIQNNYYNSAPDDDGYGASDASYFDDSDMGGDDGGWI